MNKVLAKSLKGMEQKTETRQVEILQLFAAFNPTISKKVLSGIKCFAFVDVGSTENVKLAIRQMNGMVICGRRLVVNTPICKGLAESPGNDMEMPALEAVEQSSSTESGESSTSGELEATPLSSPLPVLESKQAAYAVPMEMRSSLLVQMLKDCFGDLSWLVLIMRPIGEEVELMVTETIPHAPYFWAILLTEQAQANMQQLFSSLTSINSKQPFLMKRDITRGRRCMAECMLEEAEEGTWNRCWIIDVVGDFAVVLFIDFGSTALIPLDSIKCLDEDEFWVIPPLAQPFMLHEENWCSRKIVRTVLKGKIMVSCRSEPHILLFSVSTGEA
nr:PREDICTED: tudor domain-containing protein 10 isoform X2 [Latimeria chalumnae]XP_014344139.1 PREDICTED: tudor domain-containing protein 10 isoform X2 [Latimeria chalumnae]|eukprot:XP_014344138.1 PREDICTED: tudor domain-containing protein 10 isoform X2 [Latimeria chalumnae]